METGCLPKVLFIAQAATLIGELLLTAHIGGAMPRFGAQGILLLTDTGLGIASGINTALSIGFSNQAGSPEARRAVAHTVATSLATTVLSAIGVVIATGLH